VISDGDGGYVDFAVYVEQFDFCALAIEPLVRCWRVDMHDEGTFTQDARQTAERLIAQLPQTLAPVIPLRPKN
jgi:hypothetical protein